MRKLLVAVLAGVALLASSAVLAAPPTPLAAASAAPFVSFPPVVIGTMGDSITSGAAGGPLDSYRAELDRLLTEAQVPHTFVVAAVGGSPCEQWTASATAWVAANNLDYVLLACGTNNLVNSSTFPAFEANYRQLVTNLLAGRPGVKVFPAFIQYSAIGGYPFPAKAPAWLASSEPQVNDSIYRVITAHPAWLTRIPGLADFQKIPESYLDEMGVHPTASGYAVMGGIWYNAMRPTTGWPDLAPVVCGLSGRRPGWGSPPYRPITPGCPAL